jgi:hypothetical protein
MIQISTVLILVLICAETSVADPGDFCQDPDPDPTSQIG